MRIAFRFAAFISSVFVLGTPAAAETSACTEITSVPTYIHTSGVYCFRNSLVHANGQGSAITIVANDVVLDLNGFVLDNSGNGLTTEAWGIYGRNLKNVTIKNGTVRGFRIGLYLEDRGNNALGNVVERLLLDRNTFFGLHVTGEGSVIRDNRVVRTGGTTVGTDAYGIYAGGMGTHVVDNEVSGTFEGAGGQAYGIYASQMSGGVIERNVVASLSYGPSGSTGIAVTNGTQRITIAGNRVTNQRIGISTPHGIASLYVDNTVGGAQTPFAGGTQAGATNFSF